jgi:hypothetical protein
MFTPFLAPHLIPLFVMVALTFWVLFVLGWRRIPNAGKYPKGYYKLLRSKNGESFEPLEHVEQAARNFINLFEVPVLFYAATFVTLELRMQDDITLALSWAFVITRIIHSAIHLYPNKVIPRMTSFFIGVFVLMGLWIYLAARVFV